MKALPRHLALLLGLALLFPAGALAKSHHKAHKPSCAKLTPLALDFRREPGQQSGMLSWQAAAGEGHGQAPGATGRATC